MPKYKVTIEFETDKVIPFPADAELLQHMEAQLESLEDGTLMDELNGEMVHIIGTMKPSKIEENL